MVAIACYRPPSSVLEGKVQVGLFGSDCLENPNGPMWKTHGFLRNRTYKYSSVCFFLTSMLVYQRVIIIYYNRPEVDRV